MLGKNYFRRFVTLTTLVTVWCVYSMVALAAPTTASGEITVSGQVTVNGQPAVSNSTILSGSTITTAAGSSATVSLGKTGRVEVLEDSSLSLQFADNSIVGTVTQGKIRVANAAGVATTIATKDTTVIADAGQADSFVVEVECSHTHVDASAGIVTMREGTNDKQVVAGTTAVAGNLSQTGCKPCLRPGSAPALRFAFPWWLVLVGAAGAAVLIGTSHKDPTPGGGTIVVSPTR
ncbi:MAG: hypothetical protein ACRD43_06965 [Pyrinomonadaceae bacterium]